MLTKHDTILSKPGNVSISVFAVSLHGDEEHEQRRCSAKLQGFRVFMFYLLASLLGSMKPNFCRLQFTLLQFNFIYIVVKKHHLKALYVGRPYNNSSKTQQSDKVL